MKDALIRYAVKKGRQYMTEYQNKRASWCYALDGAHLFNDIEMAENFAGLTKGKLIEVTLTERPIRKGNNVALKQMEVYDEKDTYTI